MELRKTLDEALSRAGLRVEMGMGFMGTAGYPARFIVESQTLRVSAAAWEVRPPL